jgi:hypothetical protein
MGNMTLVAPGGCPFHLTEGDSPMRLYLTPGLIAVLTALALLAGDFQTYWP